MNNEYVKLTETTALFTGANVISKLIKILIVPLYTYYMTTSEFGTAETLQVTVSLLGPVFLLGANEAALRFSMKKEYDPADILSNCLALLLLFMAPGILLCCPLSHYSVFSGNWWFLIMLVILNAAESLLMSFTKGIGRKKIFAGSEIVSAFFLIVFNVLFLAVLGTGLRGYLWSMALASASRILFISLCIRVPQFLRLKAVKKDLLVSILKFSLPIIPGVVLWWVMNSSGRYVVMQFLGAASVGIYAIACRIASVIITLSAVFHQAWQLSAIKQYSEHGFEEFYNRVFDSYKAVMFVSAALLIAFSKPVMLLLDASYQEAWKYVPLTLLSAVFLGLSGFIYINYTVCEKTFGVFATSLAGAALCVAMSVGLTPLIGIQGAALASFVSFYFLWLIMSVHTGRLLGISNNFMPVHIDLAVIIIESLLLLRGYSYVLIALCPMVLIIINRKTMSALISGAVSFARPLRKK